MDGVSWFKHGKIPRLKLINGHVVFINWFFSRSPSAHLRIASQHNGKLHYFFAGRQVGNQRGSRGRFVHFL